MIEQTFVQDKGADPRFAVPPWTRQSPEWKWIDQELADDHLARQIDAAVTQLDLEPLFASYYGVGKRAHRPDLLLKLALYELRRGRRSPAEWAQDVREHGPLRWLVWGILPSRSRLYAFRDRLGPLLDQFNAQVLREARRQGMTTATRAALDSSTVAAHASRRRLLNASRLEKRQAHWESATQPSPRPGWMAQSVAGRRRQKQHYRRVADCLAERCQENQQRPSPDRKPPEKVLVSPADPEAVVGRDKEGVFRPFYSLVLLCDLDSPLILAYDIVAQAHDAGLFERLLPRAQTLAGRAPQAIAADAAFANQKDLIACEQAQAALYAPYQEHDYSQKQAKRRGGNQFTQIPKSEFRWLEEEQAYVCPQGHRLEFSTTTRSRRVRYDVQLRLYTCPPEHCQACPLRDRCTRNPQKGRTVSRLEREDLVEQLQARMQTDTAQELYRLRKQTVELRYADLKEHRKLRRFSGRGLQHAFHEAAAEALTNNLLALHRHAARARPAENSTQAA
jgi:transposase